MGLCVCMTCMLEHSLAIIDVCKVLINLCIYGMQYASSHCSLWHWYTCG